MKKINKIFINSYLIISLVLFAGALYSYKALKDYLSVSKNDFIGNTDVVIQKLKAKEGKLPFSFAFISDTENNDASIWLIKNILKEDIDFLVFAGDIVNDALLSEHKLFLHTMAKLKPRVPVFIVPSNHDIGENHAEGTFSRQDFEKLYGPINFSFTYNNSFFGFISNINPEDPESAEYLENTLSVIDNNIKYKFVFCARSPRRVRNILFHNESWVSDLDRIIEKYNIDYEITGDYHRRVELTDETGTRHIISGSGGSHFKESDQLGRFKSGTKITVYENAIKEELLVHNSKFTLTDNSIRHFLYNKIMPFLENKMIFFNAVTAVVLLNMLFSLYLYNSGEVA